LALLSLKVIGRFSDSSVSSKMFTVSSPALSRAPETTDSGLDWVFENLLRIFLWNANRNDQLPESTSTLTHQKFKQCFDTPKSQQYFDTQVKQSCNIPKVNWHMNDKKALVDSLSSWYFGG
jgi:hypothetical protein